MLCLKLFFLFALVQQRVADEPGGQCAGSAHSCGSVDAPNGCSRSGNVNTCDTRFCSRCDDQEGCRCSVTGFSCETVAFSVFCNGFLTCSGGPRSCSSLTSIDDCHDQSGCYWIPDDLSAVTLYDENDPGICQGSAFPCASMFSPQSCLKFGSVDTCDLDASCRASCLDQTGCACSVANYQCTSSFSGVQCEGQHVCSGFARSCSELRGRSDCQDQAGCEWIPIDVPITARPIASPTNLPTEDPASSPTGDPTQLPTSQPTEDPTSSPIGDPTLLPTSQPAEEPTFTPTGSPVLPPTTMPLLGAPPVAIDSPTTASPTKAAAEDGGNPPVNPPVSFDPNERGVPEEQDPSISSDISSVYAFAVVAHLIGLVDVLWPLYL